MKEEVECVHCGKKNKKELWCITTAYALTMNSEEVIKRNNPSLVFFCPSCGLPNSQKNEDLEEIPEN
ncbi:hypothetical protein Desaci_2885 [Desulfosporosinus acidiphilus SJ4]|uniref:Uncharacterized protein n=1 Tax=Desulfosporosinus acidiphilus (strain DSM 22704 / JCM 16185 / SJ4) TaxID=646529 RepID=I4D7M3_DESAJ|nr:hypothetical protein [Desulfosporosinus acidiphilus]AFM41797.1 hypothetical protein Desaci_2885 [Desulfosporosinus acidiphilus SJ4]